MKNCYVRYILLMSVLISVLAFPHRLLAQQSLRYYELKETGEDQTKWIELDNPTVLSSGWGNCNTCATQVTDIGFAFKYGSTTVHQFAMNTEGQVTMGSYVPGADDWHLPLAQYGTSSSSAQNEFKISVFGHDSYIRPDVGDYFSTQLVGEAPNRVRVMEFRTRYYDAAHYSYQPWENYVIKYQLQLFEGTNEIRMVYAEVPAANVGTNMYYQVGLRDKFDGAWEVFYIDESHTAHYTRANFLDSRNANNCWPGSWRYYSIAPIAAPPMHVWFRDVKPNRATIAWDRTTNAVKWELEFGKGAYGDAGNTRQVVTDTSRLFENLDPETEYHVYIKTILANGDESELLDTTFMTACAAISRNDMPWGENFDEFEYVDGYISTNQNCPAQYTGDHHYLPRGCEYGGMYYPNMNTTNGSSWPQVFLTKDPTLVYSGNAIVLRAPSSQYQNVYSAMVALPRFEVPLDSLRISFYYRLRNANETGMPLQLGYLSGPADNRVFTQIGTNFAGVNSMTYASVDLSKSGLDFSGDVQLCFRALSKVESNTEYYITIDNIVVETVKSCTPVENVRVVSDNGGSVTLTWDASAGARYYVLHTVEHDVAPTAGVGQWDTVYSNRAVLSGLAGGVLYDIYIKNQCDVNACGDSTKISVRPQCYDVPLPWYENFDEPVSDEYLTTDMLTAPAKYNDWNNPTGVGHYLPSCLRFTGRSLTTSDWPQAYVIHGNQVQYNYPVVYHGQSLILRTNGDDKKMLFVALPKFEVPLNQLSLSFWYRYRHGDHYGSTATMAVGYMANPDDTSSFSVLFNVAKTNEWRKQVYDFGNYDGRIPEGAVIAFRFDGESTDWPMVIDNISVSASRCGNGQRCDAPQQFAMTGLTDQTATLSWTASANAHHYTVEYGARNFIPGTGTVIDNIEGTLVSIPDLTAGTSYDYYFTAQCACDGGYIPSPVEHDTFRTACVAQLPYEENFESYNDAAYYRLGQCDPGNTTAEGTPLKSIPCWTYRGLNDYDYILNTYFGRIWIQGTGSWAYNSSHSLVLQSHYGAQPIAVLPYFGVGADSLRISFKYRQYDYREYGEPYLGVMTSPYDDGSFLPLMRLKSMNWVEVNGLNLADFGIDGTKYKYIAFRNRYDAIVGDYDKGYIYIDDIKVERNYGCSAPVAPVDEIVNVEGDKATLRWHSYCPEATAFKIAYGEAATFDINNPATYTVVDATGSEKVLTGLTANTQYKYSMKSVCGGGESEWGVVQQFATTCVKTLPYDEDFQEFSTFSSCWHYNCNGGHVATTMPTCWSFPDNDYYNSHTDANHSPSMYLTNQIGYPESGDRRSLALYTYSFAYTNPAVAIMPAVEKHLSETSISFWYRGNHDHFNTALLQLGVTTSLTDTSKFRPLVSKYDYTTTWTKKTYDFSQAGLSPDTTYYIAFRLVPTANHYYYHHAFIDSIQVFTNQEKPQMNVTSAWSAEYGQLCAQANWNKACDGANYTLQYSTTEDFSDGVVEVTGIGTNSHIVRGLNNGTWYWYRVKADCGEGAGSWSKVCKSYVYHQDFEGEHGWQIYNQEDYKDWWMVGSHPDAVHGGNKALYITNNSRDYKYTTAAAVYMYYDLPQRLPAANYTVRYYWKNYGWNNCSTCDYLNMNLAAQSAGFAYNMGYDIGRNLYLQNTWQYRTQKLDLAENDYRIVAYWNSNDTYCDGVPAAVDDIDLYYTPSAPSCGTPTDLTVVGTGCDSAVLRWRGYVSDEGLTTATKYVVMYGKPGFITPEFTDTVMVTDGSNVVTHTLRNLNMGTRYAYTVKAYCGVVNGYGEPCSTKVEFQTTCGKHAVPYSEDFERCAADWGASCSDGWGQNDRVTTDNWPNHRIAHCWTLKGVDAAAGDWWNAYARSYLFCPGRNDEYNHSGSYSLIFISRNAHQDITAALPEFEYSLDTLQMSFWYKHRPDDNVALSGPQLEVGYMTDRNNPATFVPLAIIPRYQNSFKQYTINYAKAGVSYPQGAVMAFCCPMTGSDNYHRRIMIDDIEVNFVPSCPEITHLKVADKLPSAVVLKWDSIPGVTQYRIEYDVRGFQEGTGRYVVYTSHPCDTLTGLSIANIYDFYVSAVKDGVACPTTMISSRSGCSPRSLETPYVEAMENPSYIVGGYFSDNTHDCSGWKGNYPLQQLPYCWEQPTMRETWQDYQHVFIYRAHGNNDQGYTWSLEYPAYTSALTFRVSDFSNAAIVTLPEFEVPIDSLKVSFYYHLSNGTENNNRMDFGYMSDPKDPGTFVALATYRNNRTEQWYKEEFDMSQYGLSALPAGAKVAFRYSAINYDRVLALDSIVVTKLPSCLPPTNVTMAGTKASNTVISWDYNHNVSGYRVEYGLHGFEVGTGTVIDIDDNNTTQLMLNLYAGSLYDFYVYNKCGDQYSDVSFQTYRTPCSGAIPVPYREDFNSYTLDISNRSDDPSDIQAPSRELPYCWRFSDLATRSDWHGSYRQASTPKVYLTRANTFAVDGNALGMASGDGKTLYAMLPLFNVPLNRLTFQFDFRAFSDYWGQTTIGYCTDPADPAGTFVPVSVPITRTSSFETIRQSFANAPENQNCYITIKHWATHQWHSYNSMFIDNVEVYESEPCGMPKNIRTLGGVTSTEDTLGFVWDAVEGATGYKVEYGRSGYTLGSGTIKTVEGNTPHITLTGFEPARKYDIWVSARCANGEYSDPAKLFFVAPCGTFDVPYVQNFDSYTDFPRHLNTDYGDSYNQHWYATYFGYNYDYMPQCWGFSGRIYSTFEGTTDNETYPYMTTYWSDWNGHPWGMSLGLHTYAYPTQSIGCMPRFKYSAQQLKIKFNYVLRNSGNSVYSIGVMTDPWDESTYTPLAELPRNCNECWIWDYTIEDFGALMPEAMRNDESTYYYIAFRDKSTTTTQTSLQIDDIRLELIQDNNTDIVAYAINGIAAENQQVEIDRENHTVSVLLPAGTDPSALVADFTLGHANATAKVGGVLQESGTTANDFTSPVTYTVIAENPDSTQEWVVTVTVPACSQPTDFDTTYVGRRRLTFAWQNANAEVAHQIVLCRTALDDDALAAADKRTVAAGVYAFDTVGLDRNTHYYAYLRSVCEGEQYSAWVPFEVTTADTISCDNVTYDYSNQLNHWDWPSYCYPFVASEYRGYTQEIYQKAMMTHESGYIGSISFNYVGGFETPRDITVYIGNTSQERMTDGWISVHNMQKVFEGTYRFYNQDGQGWCTIPFDDEFYYEGRNIVVAVMHHYNPANSGVYHDGNYRFYYTGNTNTADPLNTYQRVSRYSTNDLATWKLTFDGNGMPLVNNSVVGTYVESYRANARFNFCDFAAKCAEVKDLVATRDAEDSTSRINLAWRFDTADYFGGFDVVVSKSRLDNAALVAAIASSVDVESAGQFATGGADVKVAHVTTEARNLSLSLTELSENTPYYIYV
ncbi:MAG: hypothetical protein KBT04_07010, partial [Bacteroidales bacterium]|nr:hypothetical protein [Candidatus Colimorpha onthohippi]